MIAGKLRHYLRLFFISQKLQVLNINLIGRKAACPSIRNLQQKVLAVN